MSFGSWLKNTLFEKEDNEVKEDIDGGPVIEKDEVKNYDYHLSVFELNNKEETGRIISYILQDKKLAVVFISERCLLHFPLRYKTLNSNPFIFLYATWISCLWRNNRRKILCNCSYIRKRRV